MYRDNYRYRLIYIFFIVIIVFGHITQPYSEILNSNQQPMNWTLQYILLFFDNLFHSDVHQNVEENICHYFHFFTTLMGKDFLT